MDSKFGGGMYRRLEGLWGKNTDKEGVAEGRVNAQAFSFGHILRKAENSRPYSSKVETSFPT